MCSSEEELRDLVRVFKEGDRVGVRTERASSKLPSLFAVSAGERGGRGERKEWREEGGDGKERRREGREGRER